MPYLDGRTRFPIIVEQPNGKFRDYVWARTAADADKAGKAKWGQSTHVSSQADDYGPEPDA